MVPGARPRNLPLAGELCVSSMSGETTPCPQYLRMLPSHSMIAKGRPKKRSGLAEENLVARNRRARFDFERLEEYEAGIALCGSEVKSLRNRDVSITEAFARPRGNEIWLVGMHIKPYAQANIQNHEPLRPRKLLMHRREINKIIGRVSERGLTLVPLSLYWKHGIAKVRLAVVRGRKRIDKRHVIKNREAAREMQRATRRRMRS